MTHGHPSFTYLLPQERRLLVHFRIRPRLTLLQTPAALKSQMLRYFNISHTKIIIQKLARSGSGFGYVPLFCTAQDRFRSNVHRVSCFIHYFFYCPAVCMQLLSSGFLFIGFILVPARQNHPFPESAHHTGLVHLFAFLSLLPIHPHCA